ncbi:uncharacterized protein TM35_000741020, partial [Trypanosoma theileri]
MNFSSSVVLWIVHYTPRTRKLTPDMMLSRRFFYLLALLLSVAIVCVAADVTSIVDKATAEVEAQVDASRAAAAKAVADAQASALAAARSAADS